LVCNPPVRPTQPPTLCGIEKKSTRQEAVLYGWAGNGTSVAALAIRYRLCGIFTCKLSSLRKRWAPHLHVHSC